MPGLAGTGEETPYAPFGGGGGTSVMELMDSVGWSWCFLEKNFKNRSPTLTMPCLEFLLILTNLLRVEEEEGLFELENAADEDIGKE